MTKEEYFKEVVEPTLKHVLGVVKQKNHDYTGGTDDPFANFRMAEIEGVTPIQGILIRLQDKLQRIRTFNAKGELRVTGEGWEDACDDVIGYALLIKGLLTERAKQRDT